MALRASSGPAILCAVLDCAALGPDPRAYAAGLFEAGVDWIQLRDRSVEGQTLLRVARALVAARDASDGPHRVLVNKRLDVALSSDADGIHLGFDALEPASVAALQAPGRSIGRSLHAADEIGSPLNRGLGYAHLAPIWDPRSKAATRPALGLGVLARACEAGLPILAQGGIDPERAVAAIGVGAAGVAVTGLLDRRADAWTSARRLRRALDRARDAGSTLPSVSATSATSATSAIRSPGASR